MNSPAPRDSEQAASNAAQPSPFRLPFDNTFVRELPADRDATNRVRQVHAAYSRVLPTPVQAPRLIAYSREVAELVGLTEADCQTPEFAEVMAGNRLIPGMEPFAACYGGHQFGNWAGQLGDGRAISLGEVVNPRGERWELQLKGAGKTPYSRHADGRAVLRSSLREFLCSEAMFHLGVPTTRALSLVGTGEPVLRDILYNGNPRFEPGAVVCRVAPSFLRFGHYEIHASRDDRALLEKLVEYTLRVHFPELEGPRPDVYVTWLNEVARRTAVMVVHWMRVGFVHGVMNTDNMSILGLTIDYGPYGFLDDYDPRWTPNTTDAEGRRYRYGQQPRIAMWNLARLAEAIYPLVGSVEPLEGVLEVYSRTLAEQQTRMLADKLGFVDWRAEDQALFDALGEVLSLVETDMTIWYRRLATWPGAGADPIEHFRDAYYDPEQLSSEGRDRVRAWLGRYEERLGNDGVPAEERRARMNATNPKYVLRNYVAQLAIDRAEQGDPSLVAELLEVLRRPYDEQPEHEQYAGKRPEWARNRAGCSMLSCSS